MEWKYKTAANIKIEIHKDSPSNEQTVLEWMLLGYTQSFFYFGIITVTTYIAINIDSIIMSFWVNFSFCW